MDDNIDNNEQQKSPEKSTDIKSNTKEELMSTTSTGTGEPRQDHRQQVEHKGGADNNNNNTNKNEEQVKPQTWRNIIAARNERETCVSRTVKVDRRWISLPADTHHGLVTCVHAMLLEQHSIFFVQKSSIVINRITRRHQWGYLTISDYSGQIYSRNRINYTPLALASQQWP